MKSSCYHSGLDLHDPEDRDINEYNLLEIREKMLDKTIADSFPASDPPSTDPAPATDSFAQLEV